MKRAIAIFIVGVVLPAASAQEKTPETNSVADFVKRPVEENLAALKSKDKEIRQNAAAALFWRKSIPDSVIPDIVAGLRDKDLFVRKQLLEVLILIGMRDRRRAVVAGAAVPTLRTMLKDLSLFIRMESAKTLRRIAASERVAPVFIEGLESPNLSIRCEAAYELGKMASGPKEAIAPLRKCLDDEQAMVQLHAARALWLINRDPAVLPLLFAMAKSTEKYNRQQAIEHLGLPGMEAAKVLPILREAVRDSAGSVRAAAVRSLGTVDAKIEERLPLILTAMKNGGPVVSSEAAQALQPLGPAAKSAVPLLIAALREANYTRLRAEVMDALGAIGEGASAAAPALVEMVRSEESEEREVALKALLQIGPAARSALPAIRRVIDEDKGQIRVMAAAAAWRLGDDAKGSNIVCKTLRCKEGELRTGAALLLGEVGAPAKFMVPELRSLLRDPNAMTRLAAAYSLWRLVADESAISMLIDLLSDKQDALRCEAAVRLGMIGPPAKKAIPALKRVVHEDDDEYVQQFAAEAMEKIIPDKSKR